MLKNFLAEDDGTKQSLHPGLTRIKINLGWRRGPRKGPEAISWHAMQRSTQGCFMGNAVMYWRLRTWFCANIPKCSLDLIRYIISWLYHSDYPPSCCLWPWMGPVRGPSSQISWYFFLGHLKFVRWLVESPPPHSFGHFHLLYFSE